MSALTAFGEVLCAYTRADALADGVLVDVSDTAQEAGLRWPTALTREAWEDCVAWGEADDKRKPEYLGQDEAGRLWDVLSMLAYAVRSAKARGDAATDRFAFQLLRVPREGRALRPRLVTLIAHVGPGDSGEPVITVMQPGQD